MKTPTTPTSKTGKRSTLAVAARAARPTRVVLRATTNSDDHYVVRHLVVIRESAKKAARGVAGMTEFALIGQQTLDRQEVRDLPGASVLRPLLDTIIANTAEGRALRESLNAVTITDPDHPRITLGYFVKFDDVGYLLCVISATKPVVKIENNLVDMSNAFTKALSQLITRYRVEHLHAGRFDRLVRNEVVATDLQTAVMTNKTKIHFSGGTLNMADKNDQTMFTFQAAMADAACKSVVGNLTNGWHARAEQGCWPFAASALPGAGYKLAGTEDERIVPDVDAVDMVRDVIAWAADEKVSLTDIANGLAKTYGWGSETLRMRTGNPDATILDSRYPETAVLTLLRTALPMWLTGVYPLVARIPHVMGERDLRQGVQELVEHTDESGNEYVQPIATFELPLNHDLLPGGKWADAKLIEKAIRLRIVEAAPTPRGRAAGSDERKPLSSIGEWIDGDTQYRLSARHRENYRIIARPAHAAVDANGNRRGWTDREEDDIRAVIRPSELHQALAVAIAEQIGKTGYTRLMTGARNIDQNVVADAAQIDELERDLVAAEKAERAARFDYETARDLAIDKPTAANRDAVAEFLYARNEAQARTAAIAKRVAAVKTLGETSRRLAPGARVSLDKLLAAIVELEATENRAPAALNATLTEMLVDLRCTITDDRLRVIVETSVHLSTTDGPIVAGPIRAEVPNRRGGMRAARKEAMFECVFRDGMSFEDAARECGYSNIVEARRFLRDWMVRANVITSKGLRSAAVDCPVKEAKLVIWEMHEAARLGRAFQTPKGVDAAYAEHVRQTYTDTISWAGSWHSGNPTAARIAVNEVVAAGKRGAAWDAIRDGLGLDERTARYVEEECLLGKEAAGGCVPVLERIKGDWNRWTKPEDRTVRARTCPHCGTRTLTHIVRVPEVDGGVICTKCRRSERNGLVQYPAAYLQPWVGPRSVGTGKRGAVANTGTRIEQPCKKADRGGR